MKISVVTVCYNAVDTIEETMLSVLNQTYPDIEYIIIDGGSTDGTVDIIKKYSERLAYWVSEPDKGIYDAMNKGIAVASGDYINFMNAGDIFHNTSTIYECVCYLRSKEIDVLYGSTMQKFKNHESLSEPHPFFLNCTSVPSMGFCHQSVFVKTELIKECGFNLDYKIVADYHMMSRLYNEGRIFNEMSIIISDTDMGGISTVNPERLLFEKARMMGYKKYDPIVLYNLIKIKIYKAIHSSQ